MCIRDRICIHTIYTKFWTHIQNLTTNNVKIIDTYKAYMISCDKIWPREKYNATIYVQHFPCAIQIFMQRRVPAM